MPLKVKSVASGFVKSGKFSPARGSATSSNNPLPVGRFVPARVRRLDSGDIQLLLEQANPKKKKRTKKATKKSKPRRSTKKAPTKKVSKKRPVAKKAKRSTKSKR